MKVVIISKDQLELQLHAFLKKKSVNTSSRLERLRYQSTTMSNGSITSCEIFLGKYVMNLAAHFVACGYMEGNGIFYVALKNNEGKTMDVTDNIIDSWSGNWVRANDAFEKILQVVEDLKVFSGKMFMVWDGNHRLQA